VNAELYALPRNLESVRETTSYFSISRRAVSDDKYPVHQERSICVLDVEKKGKEIRSVLREHGSCILRDGQL
jgi:hypothetical protein